MAGTSKRKVPDMNENLDGFVPPPPPALRNASSRRMTIAGGTLPATPAWAVPVPTVPVASSASRRHAEEVLEHQDSAYNTYMTALSLEIRLRKAAVRVRHETDEQLLLVQQGTVSWMKEKVANAHVKRKVDLLGSSSSRFAQHLPRLLDEGVLILRQCAPLEELAECINSNMNSLKCKQVKPIEDEKESGIVEESLNDLAEDFCIPHETKEVYGNAADCLRDLGESINVAIEENKCLNQLKDTNYRLLAQNFASTVKL